MWPTAPRTAAVVALASFAVLLPLMGLRYELAHDTPLYHFAHAFDIPAAIAIVAALPALRRERAAPETFIGLVLLGLVAVALLAHPSARGSHFFVRLAAAGALAGATASLAAHGDRRVLVAALGVAAALQTVVAALQVWHGGPLGWWWLGEFADPMERWGTAVSPRGTLSDAGVLAGLALVASVTLARQALAAARPWPWLALATIAVAPIGLTHSRTAALALGLACACLALGALRAPWYRWALAALLAGAAIPALATWDGWVASGGRGVATDRGILLAQATAITAGSPLVGVGPASYDDALAARTDLHDGRRLQPVHSVPMLFAAESGVPAAIVALVLLGAVLARARQRGPATLALAAALVPFLLVDQWPYTNTVGLGVVGTWLGLARWRSDG